MSFLCDTNVISELMKRSPNPQVENWINQQEQITVSVITVDEIYAGLSYKDAHRQTEWFKRFL